MTDDSDRIRFANPDYDIIGSIDDDVERIEFPDEDTDITIGPMNHDDTSDGTSDSYDVTMPDDPPPEAWVEDGDTWDDVARKMGMGGMPSDEREVVTHGDGDPWSDGPTGTVYRLPNGHEYEMGVLHACGVDGCPADVSDRVDVKPHTDPYAYDPDRPNPYSDHPYGGGGGSGEAEPMAMYHSHAGHAADMHDLGPLDDGHGYVRKVALLVSILGIELASVGLGTLGYIPLEITAVVVAMSSAMIALICLHEVRD